MRPVEYFQQRAHYLGTLAEDRDALWLPYETSRGCWWGEKHHCTFCGINGTGMQFREKSPDLERPVRAAGTERDARGPRGRRPRSALRPGR